MGCTLGKMESQVEGLGLSGKRRGKRHGELLKNKQGGVQMLGQGKGSYRDPKARRSERLLHNPKMGDDSL